LNPHIKNSNLVIPVDCDPKYKYWDGGQSIMATLEELKASEEVKNKYRNNIGMKKSE